MKSLDIDRLLRDVAKEYATTPEVVRKGIEEAIETAWEIPDPEIHAQWVAMSPKGVCPTVEEAILYLTALTTTERVMIEEIRSTYTC